MHPVPAMLAGWRMHFCKEWPLGIAGDVLQAVMQPERIAPAAGTPPRHPRRQPPAPPLPGKVAGDCRQVPDDGRLFFAVVTAPGAAGSEPETAVFPYGRCAPARK